MTGEAFELIRGEHNLRGRHRGSVLSLGGFDSLHIGHQALIERMTVLARDIGAPPTVAMFEPLPGEFFNRAAGRVQTLRRRLVVLRELGVLRVLCLRFDRRVAETSAEDFIRRVLVEGLAVRHVIVGERFRFGRQSRGSVGTLRDAGRAHGFGVTAVREVTLDDERVSTTRVCAALAVGDIAQAERCLARPYVLNARVAHGAGRGARLGFPTANLILSPPPPLRGVFSADITTPDGVVHRGVINAGVAPTFGGARYKIEAHIPGFSERLWARRLAVRVLAKLRDERKFPSPGELKAQLQKDVEMAVRASA